MFKGKEYMTLYFENQKEEQRLNKVHETTITEALKNREEERQSIYEQQMANRNKLAKAAKIRHEVKKSLLFECIYKVYNGALNIPLRDELTESMIKSFVNEFIEENGVEKLLLSFNSKTALLSEFSRLVNKYTNIICEKSNVENPDNFCLDSEDKDNFYDELDMEDVEDASTMIKTRVSSAIDNFLSNNLSDKEEIKEIIKQSQDKIAGTKNEELKESFEHMAKKKITNVRERRAKSVFESMVFNLAKSSVVNEDMKKIYMKDNKLDMDKIVETCNLMYTLLETVSTCKMINVDEAYVKKVLEDIK